MSVTAKRNAKDSVFADIFENLAEHGKEAIDIMMALFDDEYIQAAYGKEIQRESIVSTWAASVRNIMQKFHISDKNAAIDAVGVPNELRQTVSEAI